MNYKLYTLADDSCILIVLTGIDVSWGSTALIQMCVIIRAAKVGKPHTTCAFTKERRSSCDCTYGACEVEHSVEQKQAIPLMIGISGWAIRLQSIFSTKIYAIEEYFRIYIYILADDPGIIATPSIITNCSPHSIVLHLHSACMLPQWTVSQTHTLVNCTNKISLCTHNTLNFTMRHSDSAHKQSRKPDPLKN